MPGCGNSESSAGFLGENDLMAYLTMMANRLLQLHRVLKPTGSLYLHCDPTASHYLKIVLDGVFGKRITRTRSYGSEQLRTAITEWSRVADSIFFYSKSDRFTWNTPRDEHSEEYRDTKYRYDDADGRGVYLSTI